MFLQLLLCLLFIHYTEVSKPPIIPDKLINITIASGVSTLEFSGFSNTTVFAVIHLHSIFNNLLASSSTHFDYHSTQEDPVPGGFIKAPDEKYASSSIDLMIKRTPFGTNVSRGPEKVLNYFTSVLTFFPGSVYSKKDASSGLENDVELRYDLYAAPLVCSGGHYGSWSQDPTAYHIAKILSFMVRPKSYKHAKLITSLYPSDLVSNPITKAYELGLTRRPGTASILTILVSRVDGNRTWSTNYGSNILYGCPKAPVTFDYLGDYSSGVSNKSRQLDCTILPPDQPIVYFPIALLLIASFLYAVMCHYWVWPRCAASIMIATALFVTIIIYRYWPHPSNAITITIIIIVVSVIVTLIASFLIWWRCIHPTLHYYRAFGRGPLLRTGGGGQQTRSLFNRNHHQYTLLVNQTMDAPNGQHATTEGEASEKRRPQPTTGHTVSGPSIASSGDDTLQYTLLDTTTLLQSDASQQQHISHLLLLPTANNNNNADVSTVTSNLSSAQYRRLATTTSSTNSRRQRRSSSSTSLLESPDSSRRSVLSKCVARLRHCLAYFKASSSADETDNNIRRLSLRPRRIARMPPTLLATFLILACLSYALDYKSAFNASPVKFVSAFFVVGIIVLCLSTIFKNLAFSLSTTLVGFYLSLSCLCLFVLQRSLLPHIIIEMLLRLVWVKYRLSHVQIDFYGINDIILITTWLVATAIMSLLTLFTLRLDDARELSEAQHPRRSSITLSGPGDDPIHQTNFFTSINANNQSRGDGTTNSIADTGAQTNDHASGDDRQQLIASAPSYSSLYGSDEAQRSAPNQLNNNSTSTSEAPEPIGQRNKERQRQTSGSVVAFNDLVATASATSQALLVPLSRVQLAKRLPPPARRQ